jgi:hypothetical protein
MMNTCCSKHVEAWNKYIKKECVKLVINRNYFKMRGHQNMKLCIYNLFEWLWFMFFQIYIITWQQRLPHFSKSFLLFWCVSWFYKRNLLWMSSVSAFCCASYFFLRIMYPSRTSQNSHLETFLYCPFIRISSASNNSSLHDATAPSGPGPSHYRRFMITLRYTTLGRTPLDEWSARRRYLYLTTQNTHNRHTSLSPAGFELTQTHALDRAATEIGVQYQITF